MAPGLDECKRREGIKNIKALKPSNKKTSRNVRHPQKYETGNQN
jgi:hypothetical protein